MYLITGVVVLVCVLALPAISHSVPLGDCMREVPNDPSPQSVLPMYDNDLNNHQPSLQSIKQEYDKGMSRCLRELDVYEYAVHREIRSTQYDTVLGEKCRGHDTLHQLTGMLLMPFGPTECELHSHCWLGVLSCGTPQDNKIKMGEQAGNNYSGELIVHVCMNSHLIGVLIWLGWSVGSLHFQIVVQGAEIVVPTQRLVTHYSAHSVHNMDAIIGTYAMSIPGLYSVEMRLHGWLIDPRHHVLSALIDLFFRYRGRLFRPLTDTQFQDSDIVGYEHLGSKFI